jgi:BirA family biotin operon repressor/biotin-[acetyl-CoA-carboxylase] ligase
MKVYTDSVDYAHQVLGRVPVWRPTSTCDMEEQVQFPAGKLFAGRKVFTGRFSRGALWQHLFLVESAAGSQYDLLIRHLRENRHLPDGLVCLAGSGTGFHGFRNRSWAALSGNLHLTVFLAPLKAVPSYGAAFMALPAVSALETIDAVPGLGGRARIKWVNDVLLEDAKVCGVLAYSQTQGTTVTGIVLGLGLNVEARPRIAANPFVPTTGCLREFAPPGSACTQRTVLDTLLQRLEANYAAVLTGDSVSLIDRYRQRSCVVGRKVRVCDDDDTEKFVQGRVTRIGDNLELYLEGNSTPLSRGRLILEPTQNGPDGC